MSSIPLILQAEAHPGRTAIVDREGSHTYRDLLDASARAAAGLLAGRASLDGARIAFLMPSGFEHVAVEWGVWRAGGIAVPLTAQHPKPELAYELDLLKVEALVAHPESRALLGELAAERELPLHAASELLRAAPAALPDVRPERPALVVFTSGTTARPKGVVLSHANLAFQVETLVKAWGWRADDRILHVLPLHHVHGIVNVLCCPLWAGACCEMHAKFEPETAWARLAGGEITVFMAVPTIYARLIAAYEAQPPERRRELSARAAKLRLMVSGSAALPEETLRRWRELTGHVLLERYGMTEIGMALSNPLHGERRPRHVGQPLPGVEVKLRDEQGRPVGDGQPGELYVRGPGVFKQYWENPDATAASFVDGWFRTGDTAVLEDGSYRILGRNSVDIIKTGGYKVSALEIEDVLLKRPEIAECAVLGLPDPEWGERVCAVVVPKAGAAVSLDELRPWAKERLAGYKVPTRLVTLEALPRNAMGKVSKPEVLKIVQRMP
ncbi:MAG: acyl-CoA synthetase [Planctomycetota bacterium]|nr:acyl-CoA synthetase [Planctomycetota bacterium]